MIIFTDRCLEQIGTEIASLEPEVGGALLSLPKSNIICELVPDPRARTSTASYLPSSELTEKVRAAEGTFDLEFAGIIHSHPGNMTHPSGQDYRAFALFLATNPRLSSFAAPIVTVSNRYGHADPNQISLTPRGTLTMHVAYRKQRWVDLNQLNAHKDFPRGVTWPSGSPVGFSEQSRPFFSRSQHASEQYESDVSVSFRNDFSDPRNDGVDMYNAPAGELRVDGDITLLRSLLGRRLDLEWIGSEVSYPEVGGAHFISSSLRFSTLEVVILMPIGYPFAPPVVLVTPMECCTLGATEQVHFSWPIGDHEVRLDELAEAISRSVLRDDSGREAGLAS